MATRVLNYLRPKRAGRPRSEPRPVLAHDPALVEIQNADGTPFRPLFEQRKFMQTIDESVGLFTVPELCGRAGIARSRFYRWRQDPAFNTWLARRFQTYLDLESWNLIGIARFNAAYKFQYFNWLAKLSFTPEGRATMDAWRQHM
jgi:hypothetical protein